MVTLPPLPPDPRVANLIPVDPTTSAAALNVAAAALASIGPPVETRSYKGVVYYIQLGFDSKWYARCGASAGMADTRESLIGLVEYSIDEGDF
jgi:hypothetical protein